ncbi:MAG: ATP-dependent Clp protease ATP-binding subunit [bacterium]
MFDRFTERARQVIMLARGESKRLGHSYVGTEHILLGLVKEGGGVAVNALENLGLSLERIRISIEKTFADTTSDTMVQGEAPFTPRAKKALEYAVQESQQLGHNYIGTEHLLLGLMRDSEGVAAQILTSLGVTIDRLREEIINLLSGMATSTKKQKSKTPVLDEFGVDITQQAREGKLDPVIGRLEEIERVIHILSRRRKNNPVLVGEPGVGKTAIVEGLAQRIVNNEVPESLYNKRIVTLDLGLLVAGTKYRGQFEERIKYVMDEVKKDKDVILFIDELHTIVGAGGAEGALDASNILKPALAKGEFQCIGATTLDEYRQRIEKNGALERRFQMVLVEPNTVEETIEILKGLRPKYEEHHHVRYTDEALFVATQLADRYISGRLLPDKAIDLIDEAGAKVRLATSVIPPEIKELNQKLAQVNKEKGEAVKVQDFELAAQLRDKERQLKNELNKARQRWSNNKDNYGAVVTADDIAYVVSRWTKIPIVKLETDESLRLLRMEEELHKRVISQDEAISALSKAIRRSRAGIGNPNRPIGSFIFLGPTGVGKTELARALAEFMFGDQDALIRIDMSEYMERFNASRLVGAPPGYVGYDEGGELTEKVRRRPYSVVLFDEIEKAHPDVFNMLLQVLDDGHLTDATGRKVDFKNTVIIMTSNVGSREIRSGFSIGFRADSEATTENDYKVMKSRVMDELKRVFTPEFLNRIDDVIVFRALTRDDIRRIADLRIGELQERLKEKGITIEITAKAKEFLIDKGYDPVYGARPLQRTIQKYVEDALSEDIIRGEYEGGGSALIDLEDDKIVVRKHEEKESIATTQENE